MPTQSSGSRPSNSVATGVPIVMPSTERAISWSAPGRTPTSRSSGISGTPSQRGGADIGPTDLVGHAVEGHDPLDERAGEHVGERELDRSVNHPADGEPPRLEVHVRDGQRGIDPVEGGIPGEEPGVHGRERRRCDGAAGGGGRPRACGPCRVIGGARPHHRRPPRRRPRRGSRRRRRLAGRLPPRRWAAGERRTGRRSSSRVTATTSAPTSEGSASSGAAAGRVSAAAAPTRPSAAAPANPVMRLRWAATPSSTASSRQHEPDPGKQDRLVRGAQRRDRELLDRRRCRIDEHRADSDQGAGLWAAERGRDQLCGRDAGGHGEQPRHRGSNPTGHGAPPSRNATGPAASTRRSP